MNRLLCPSVHIHPCSFEHQFVYFYARPSVNLSVYPTVRLNVYPSQRLSHMAGDTSTILNITNLTYHQQFLPFPSLISVCNKNSLEYIRVDILLNYINSVILQLSSVTRLWRPQFRTILKINTRLYLILFSVIKE